MDVENMKTPENMEEPNNTTSLTARIAELEAENKKIRDEFNVQRAKMKDLFLQKEEEFSKEKIRLNAETQKIKDELNEVRSQLLIADMKLETDLEVEKRKREEEIASLEQLVHETVEESSSSRNFYNIEVRKLQETIQQLKDENQNLKSYGLQSSPHHHHHHHHGAQESGGGSGGGSLAPSVMLSAVTKTLARKLGADTFSTQENLEESMRRAQEDAEMLRSLVMPLEEEIKALKDKLRSTDEQLQKCILCGHNSNNKQSPTTTTTTTTHSEDVNIVQEAAAAPPPINSDDKAQIVVEAPPQSPTCDMCSNYEAQLQREQERNSELEARLVAAEKGMERHKEDLLKEIGFRREMEEKWNEKKEEHKQQVNELNKRTVCSEQDLQELRRAFNEYSAGVTEQLEQLTKQREMVHERLVMLQKENDRLVGKYTIHSQQMQNEAINLPDTVEELQEKLLKLQEDLIISVVGKESAEETERTLQGDIILLRTQNDDLMAQMDQMKRDNEDLMKEKRDFNTMKEKYKQSEKRIHEQVAQLQLQLQEATKKMKTLEEHNKELRMRVQSLQQELDNSEHVQKDFVMLSQSLQVQLEKIRGSDTQVRWQHEDDVDECPGCRGVFSAASSVPGARRTTSAPKQNCLHCGQVFCLNCLNRTVASGPKQRPARVCDVCHTLLVKTSAPYFSTEPPHSPD